MDPVYLELLYGTHAHADALASVDVSAELAGRLPGVESHSIWQLVTHMNFWMDQELKRIEGRPDPYPEHAAETWPENKAPTETPTETEWRGELGRFKQHLIRLAEHSRQSEHELARTIPPTDSAEAGHASSLEALLWRTLVHNSYHLGQVVAARRALGAWPPARGADTW